MSFLASELIIPQCNGLVGIFFRAVLCWFNSGYWIFPAMIHQNVDYL